MANGILLNESVVKVCTRCQQSLPATSEHFQVQRHGKHGLSAACKLCRNAYARDLARDKKENPEKYAPRQAIDPDPYKTCSGCGVSFPATPEYFFAERRGKYGLRSRCKTCFRVRTEARRKHVLAAPELYAQHRARQLPREAARRRKPLTEEQRARKRQSANAYRVRKLAAIWAGPEDEREIFLARQCEYERRRRQRLPPEKRNLSSLMWKHRMRANGGTLTTEEVRAKHIRQQGLCYWCGGPFGPKPHIDHVIPISKGGLNDDGNTVLSCPTCNHRKGNLDLDIWLARIQRHAD